MSNLTQDIKNVEQELSKMPITMATASLRQKKHGLEDKIEALEKNIKNLSRPGPIWIRKEVLTVDPETIRRVEQSVQRESVQSSIPKSIRRSPAKEQSAHENVSNWLKTTSSPKIIIAE
jgi:hypothetical protein